MNMTDIRQESIRKANEQFNLVAKAAEELGFSYGSHEDELGRKYNFVINPPGEGESLVVEFLDYMKTPKIEVRGIYPVSPHQFGAESPKAGTTVKQGAKGIVNAVKRLLPQYRELMERSWERKARDQDYEARIAANRERLANIKGVSEVGDSLWAGGAVVRPLADAVVIDRLSVSVNKAERILAILTE